MVVKLEEAALSKTRTPIATTGQAKDYALDNTPLGWLPTAPSLAPRTSKMTPVANNGLVKDCVSKETTLLG